ncbi:MAG: ATP-binding protein [Leptolyngbyaceae cyanobacterium MO_188.B28]|nr:ATP-binding protein [Leptolyngbyaceae cyanobacterium MO_188.B28]
MAATVSSHDRWRGENHNYLMAQVAQVQSAIERRLGPQKGGEAPPVQVFPADLPPPALDALCDRFDLSPFERSVLVLCVGSALSYGFGRLCASLHGDEQHPFPTFGVALMLFNYGDWGALTPAAPLRRWRLIEVLPGGELTHSPLRIDERILHQLMGVPAIDERLEGTVRSLSTEMPWPLPTSYQQIADQIVRLGGWDCGQSTPVVQLCGLEGATKRAIAVAAAAQVGLSLHVIAADALPTELSQANLWQCVCERESFLTNSGLLLDCDALPSPAIGESAYASLNGMIARLIETCDRPLLITSRDPRPQRQRPLITFNITPPAPPEQRQLWRTHLGDRAAALNGHIDRLVTYFNLGPPAIQRACLTLQGYPDDPVSADGLPQKLWQACLVQARPRLGELAQPIPTKATWDDLVLPEKEIQVLKTLTAQVRQRSTVYEHWGFSKSGTRGLGISALFAGASGTGKTLAAEVIAQALHLDLYRIDLSATVSKYIGETEKNLRKIFDAAETGGAILLFDEADALFGKRSEVTDARDRYANMEVAYLLQRIEAYRGLAILTSNLKDSLDQAFLRRIRFVVSFPFPDASQREKIWRLCFPPQTPTDGLNYKKLAKLNVAGGNIRNIALNAAFLAAEAGMEVGMEQILQAAQSEYIKLERPLTDREVKGWVPDLSAL